MILNNKPLKPLAIAIISALGMTGYTGCAQAQNSAAEQVEQAQVLDSINNVLPQKDDYQTQYRQYSMVDFRSYLGDGQYESNSGYFSTGNFALTSALGSFKSVGTLGSWAAYFAIDWTGYIIGEAARRAGDKKTASYFPTGGINPVDIEIGNNSVANDLELVLEVTSTATFGMVSNYYYSYGVDIMTGMASGDMSFIADRVDGSNSEVAGYLSMATSGSSSSGGSSEENPQADCKYLSDTYKANDGITRLCSYGINGDYKFARGGAAGEDFDLIMIENGGEVVMDSVKYHLVEDYESCSEKQRHGFQNFEGVKSSCHDDFVENSAWAKTFSGDDTIIETTKVEAGDGNDRIYSYAFADGGNGDDLLNVDAYATYPRRIVSIGGQGNDIINGGKSADFISAGPGDDLITDNLNYTFASDDIDIYGYIDHQATMDEYVTRSNINAEQVPGTINYIDGGEGTDSARFIVKSTPASNLVIKGAGVGFAQNTDFGPLLTVPASIPETKEYRYDYQIISTSVSDKPLAELYSVEELSIVAQDFNMTLNAQALTIPLNLQGSPMADRIDSGSGDDFIRTFGGHDHITTGTGDDVIDGGTGNDNIDAGSGDDLIFPGSGLDLINGGEGTDTLNYVNHPYGLDIQINAGKTLVLDSNTIADHPVKVDTFVSIENLIGSHFNDLLKGSAQKNVLAGGDGDDIIYGMGGADELSGDQGNDKLFGGGGADILFGGSGKDELTGGNGADIFRLNQIETIENTTLIKDFDATEGDQIVINAQAIGIYEQADGTLNYGRDAQGAARKLYYQSTNQQLILKSDNGSQVLVSFIDPVSLKVSDIRFENLLVQTASTTVTADLMQWEKAIDATVRTFELPEDYTSNKVVIHSAASSNGSDSGVVQMYRSKDNLINLNYAEWEDDGHHTLESLDLLVAKQAHQTMNDGSQWEFGLVDGPQLTFVSHSVKFKQAFEQAPLVFLSVKTSTQNTVMMPIVGSVTQNGFELFLTGKHAEQLHSLEPLQIHYVAVQGKPGSSQHAGVFSTQQGDIPYQLYETTLTDQDKQIGNHTYYLQPVTSSDRDLPEYKVVVMDLGDTSFIQRVGQHVTKTAVPRRR